MEKNVGIQKCILRSKTKLSESDFLKVCKPVLKDLEEIGIGVGNRFIYSSINNPIYIDNSWEKEIMKALKKNITVYDGLEFIECKWFVEFDYGSYMYIDAEEEDKENV